MAKAKPGTPHPTKRGLVMGTKGRYVAKSTYNKQVKAAKTSASKPAAKPAPKALPPKATTGGRRYSSGTASSRRAQAAAKQVRAAQGTKSSTVRQGQPAGAANRRFGADRVAKSVRRAQVETAVRGAAKRLGRVAGPVAAISTGAEIGEAMRKNLPVNTAGSGRGAGRRAFAGTKNKAKAKSSQSKKSGMTPAQVKKAQAKANADRRAGKLSNISAPKAKVKAKVKAKPKATTTKVTPKPKVKKGSGVSGVGPVKSGRAYSVAKTGKSVSRQRVDELRAMRERSKKRQAEMKKKKK